MKKLTVFSFFNSSNIGDLLIAECALNFFLGLQNCSFCDISGERIDVDQWRKKNLQKQTSSCCTESIGKIKKALLKNNITRSVISFYKANQSVIPQNILKNTEDSETVVYFGGNLVMELCKLPTSILVLYRSIRALKSCGKKVFLCAVGVGPFNNRKSRKIASEIFALADGISVRDDASYQLVKELAPQKEVSILRDPVLTVNYAYTASEEKKAIGVNVYFGPDKIMFKKMKEPFSKAVAYLRRTYPEYMIYLFSSEKMDYPDSIAIKADFTEDHMVVVKEIGTADDLFALHNQVDCVIGTRMHTVITAMVSHKPVLTIAWQRKVTSLMDYFENTQWNIPMQTFAKEPAAFQRKFDSLMGSRECVTQKNAQKISEIKNTYSEQIEQLLEGV